MEVYILAVARGIELAESYPNCEIIEKDCSAVVSAFSGTKAYKALDLVFPLCIDCTDISIFIYLYIYRKLPKALLKNEKTNLYTSKFIYVVIRLP